MKLLPMGLLVCSACVFNGKAIGPGSASAAPQEMASGAHDSHDGLPQYANAPADPEQAIDADQPRRRATEDWIARDTEMACTAVHDHCLEPDTWFLLQDADLKRLPDRPMISASVATFSAKGTLYPANVNAVWVRENYVAYHTVPATKATLVPGAIVFGWSRPHGIPSSGVEAVRETWNYGVVDSVDLDIGIYHLKGYTDTLQVEGARVAVFSWRPGEKVQVVGNRPRAALAVRAADVLLPAKS